MKVFKGIATDKETKQKVIIESEYKTKKDFIKDVRHNGYSINPKKVKEAKVFDYILDNTNATEEDWKRY